MDVDTAIDAARLWFDTKAAAEFGPPKRDQLIVFDIDETVLCNIKARIGSRMCSTASVSAVGMSGMDKLRSRRHVHDQRLAGLLSALHSGHITLCTAAHVRVSHPAELVTGLDAAAGASMAGRPEVPLYKLNK